MNLVGQFFWFVHQDEIRGRGGDMTLVRAEFWGQNDKNFNKFNVTKNMLFCN